MESARTVVASMRLYDLFSQNVGRILLFQSLQEFEVARPQVWRRLVTQTGVYTLAVHCAGQVSSCILNLEWVKIFSSPAAKIALRIGIPRSCSAPGELVRPKLLCCEQISHF